VMDWVSLQPQARPAAVEPHEIRLDAGAVQVEIQRMVKQGGGQVVMELTPPDQSKFTIELKLDERGGAYLVVDGASDSTRTRLEQSAPQLHEQFQQMGLNLQLDMRQHRESAFSGSQESLSDGNNTQVQSSEPTAPMSRAAVASRARDAGVSQVYLYA
jgi:flagellar hook-length control protein FliK